MRYEAYSLRIRGNGGIMPYLQFTGGRIGSHGNEVENEKREGSQVSACGSDCWILNYLGEYSSIIRAKDKRHWNAQ